ncbi:hypothetical protein Pst134EA_000035 [Puccinia striiformis f. sp. tritici]|uniref:hypothetical protein n=1 Tax=Puccinia striiformis f. sp. tritici TaxID=168172 RepID=UPI002008D6D8|nr:hypothetical protein Pst134EA_000035 [Puccinia striiformis f. sp. tritici]KAH9472951.1 hypothetical protein Pst134EA_000035 [Puccinia striiformis f. sp. tritici]KAI9601704.1 hypothetical protein H4Q26_001537 [Puccinia striiformis f. sp. tritici PST-130]
MDQQPNEAAVSAQRERFLEFHSQINQPAEEFEFFYSTVGLPAVQEHLDALESICTNLKVDKSEFVTGWCDLLKRIQPFATIVFLFDMEHNESLQKEVSRLAFARNHPKLPANFLISHEKRIEAINSKSSQEAVTLLETLQTDQLAMPLDGDTFAQWTRFLEIHPSLVNAEEAFLYFYHVAGLKAVQEHLNAIGSLCADLKVDNSRFTRSWCSLLNRKSDFAQTLYLLGIQSNQSLQKEASQLAYVHHHPESCQRPETNHEKREDPGKPVASHLM